VDVSVQWCYCNSCVDLSGCTTWDFVVSIASNDRMTMTDEPVRTSKEAVMVCF
jgi:hypothetical protein